MVIQESVFSEALPKIDFSESIDVPSIALVSIINKEKNFALNKDLNGGYGTADDYSGSWIARVARSIKRSSVRLLVISFAYLQAILKERGFQVKYFEEHLPDAKGKQYDVILLYGTIVDYKFENKICRELKNTFPKAKIGFFGPFPSVKPDLFPDADFVILGEAESFFMNDFKSIDQLTGHVAVSSLADNDDIPTLDLDDFPIDKYSYSLSPFKKRFITLQGSKGCPYSCSYYCTYGAIQGSAIRQRSAKRLVNDIVSLKDKYGIKVIQFRDAVFGLEKNFVNEFCEELKRRDVKITWGMETRLDLIDEGTLRRMFDAGLRIINVGIETSNINVARRNKRLLVDSSHQERMIRLCSEIGIQVAAFYLFGLESDTIESIRKTIDYAIYLNTPVARFAIVTPYPGTEFYAKLEREGRILTHDYEKYTQFNLVYKHENISPDEVQKLLFEAYRRYYCRPSYLFSLIKWKTSCFMRSITCKLSF